MFQIKPSAVLTPGDAKHQVYVKGDMIEVMASSKREARSIIENRGYKVMFVTRMI